MEFDMASDGYAVGYPGDTQVMRVCYRTPGAILRMCEQIVGVDLMAFEDSERVKQKQAHTAYILGGYQPVTGLRKFVAKATGLKKREVEENG